MRKAIVVIGLLVTGLIFPADSGAQVSNRRIDSADFIPKDPKFNEIRIFFNEFQYTKAIRLAKRLSQQRKDKDLAQAAAFLLGDLYTFAGDNGERNKYKQAIIAFQSARRKYPNSQEAIIALWKIGSIYLKREMYYEAIASFNRIIQKTPHHPVALSAQLGKGQAYSAINKEQEAIGIFDEINPSLLSHTERMVLLLSYGNAFFKLNYLNTAHEYYKLVSIDEALLLADALTVYQYGIAALQAKDYSQARETFGALARAYRGDPKALLGLARIGDAWRLEGMSLRAESFYREVEASKKEDLAYQEAHLIAAVGELHLAGCFPKPLLVRQSDCDKMKALESESGRAAAQRIKNISAILIDQIENSGQSEAFLLEAVSALERHRAYTTALWLKEKSLKKNISTKMRGHFEQTFKNTLMHSIEQLLNREDVLEALDLYFRYPKHFSDNKVNAPLALRIAIHLIDTGFFRQALALLDPVTEVKNPRINKEVLYRLIQASFYQGDLEGADRYIQRFTAQYPKSVRIPSLQTISAEILDREGKAEAAISAYRDWLKAHPNHREKQKIQGLLAKAYENKGDLERSIAFYQEVKKGLEKDDPNLLLHLADLYYRHKNFEEAKTYYQAALKGLDQTSPKREWATLQLANTHERLGERDKGAPLFTGLAGEAKDDLIQGLAAQKAGNGSIP